MKCKPSLYFLVLTAAVILLNSCNDVAANANSNEVWPTYENQNYGYAFSYPAGCTYGPLPMDCKSTPPEERGDACLCFMNPENPDRVLLQKFQNDGDQRVLAEFSIARLTMPAENLPDETGLMAWLAENFPDKWESAEVAPMQLDGNPAVSLSSPSSELAPAIREIYFIHSGSLFQISMLQPDVEINRSLYEHILSSFRLEEIGASLVQTETPQDTGSDLWTVYEDEEYGVRFAVPCFWEVNFPAQYHPSGTAYPIRNYSEAFSMSFGKNHNAVWENGGIKIDMNFISGETWGLPDDATLEDFLTVIDTDADPSIEEVLINKQKGLRVTSKVQLGGEVHSYYLFKVSENLFLSFEVYPSQAIDNPDVQGILHSLAFSPDVEVVIPEIIPGAAPLNPETAAPPAASEPGDAPNFTLTGIVREVSPSARIIWLQAEVDGFTTLALTADSTVTTASGEPLALAQIQRGVTVRVSGQPGDHQTLLAHSVQVITPSDPQGYLTFPYQSADAGNFFLQAGDEIAITWEQAPPGAASYAFVFTGSDDGVAQTIGIDADGLNGVATTMTVPEHLNGQLVALAQFENGAQIRSVASAVYSGKLPPENVCSLQANGVGITNIYREPEMNSPQFAYLTPGTYATVIQKIDDDWYLIDASVALNTTENTAAQGEGWVNAGNSSVSLHGPCENIPDGE
jgi:hypothetical protein